MIHLRVLQESGSSAVPLSSSLLFFFLTLTLLFPPATVRCDTRYGVRRIARMLTKPSIMCRTVPLRGWGVMR